MTTTDAPLYLDYYEHLLRLDRAGALRVVDGYLAERGGDVAGLYADVLVPALIHTGQQWQEERISVAHEHYISEVTRDLILRYGPRIWAANVGASGAAVACCAPGERHVLGLLMASDVLRATGLEVHLLGEGAPPESIRDFIAETGADVLALSVSIPEHLDEAAELVAMARSANPRLVVIAGGRGLADLPDAAARPRRRRRHRRPPRPPPPPPRAARPRRLIRIATPRPWPRAARVVDCSYTCATAPAPLTNTDRDAHHAPRATAGGPADRGRLRRRARRAARRRRRPRLRRPALQHRLRLRRLRRPPGRRRLPRLVARLGPARSHRVLADDGTFWLAIGDEFAAELKVLFHRELGFHLRTWVIWYYTFGVHCARKFAGATPTSSTS